MAVSVSPNGKNHYETSGPTDEVLIGTANGIVALARSGGEWRESRRMIEDKHIGSIAIEPTRGVIFAGAHKGGLRASEDNGRTWERRDSGIESDDIYGLNCVVAGNELRVYAGTEPAHLYVSTDFGKSWTEMSGFYEDVHRLMTVAGKPNDVYMSTGRNLYHSGDKGGKWNVMPLPENRIQYPDALVILPQQPEVMFTAGASDSPGRWRNTKDADAAIARTRDGGRTWNYLAGGLPGHLRGNIEGMTMNAFPGGFELVAGTTDGDVFFSEDEGETWATIGSSLPPVSKGGHYRNLRDD